MYLDTSASKEMCNTLIFPNVDFSETKSNFKETDFFFNEIF